MMNDRETRALDLLVANTLGPNIDHMTDEELDQLDIGPELIPEETTRLDRLGSFQDVLNRRG